MASGLFGLWVSPEIVALLHMSGGGPPKRCIEHRRHSHVSRRCRQSFCSVFDCFRFRTENQPKTFNRLLFDRAPDARRNPSRKIVAASSRPAANSGTMPAANVTARKAERACSVLPPVR